MPSSSASVAETPSSSPLDEPPLDLAALRGRVAGAVGREAVAVSSWPSRSSVKRWISSAALRLFAKQSVRRPRSTSSASSREASPSALARTPSSSSSSGGFQSAIVRSARGARVVLDDGDVDSERAPAPSSPGFAIVAEASRNCGLGAVHARQPAEPAQHVADVRAEDAAVDVRLVDDDVGEVGEHVAPAVVVGEDADVEHVRVREHEVRPLADLPPSLRLRVAVVDRRLHARHLQLLERAQPGPGRAPSSGRGRCARFFGSAASASSTGRLNASDFPLAVPVTTATCSPARGRRPGLRLMRVELLDAARLERPAHLRVQLVRKGRGASLARGLACDVCELLSFEDPRPRRQLDRHPDEGSVRP